MLHLKLISYVSDTLLIMGSYRKRFNQLDKRFMGGVVAQQPTSNLRI